jgi:hypothetical protein
VLSKMTPKQRAEIIHKFLEVAKVSLPRGERISRTRKICFVV